MTKQGKLIILSAPSGSGKNTIINALMERGTLNLAFSVSATSRPPRGDERDGVNYYFLTPEQFRGKIGNGEFVEYEEVYPGRYYGTLRSEIDRICQLGRNCILDLDVVGALNVKKMFGHRALALFVMPPNLKELERRLTLRGTETAEEIRRRISKASHELAYAQRFDARVVNDCLEQAVDEAEATINRFLQQ